MKKSIGLGITFLLVSLSVSAEESMFRIVRDLFTFGHRPKLTEIKTDKVYTCMMVAHNETPPFRPPFMEGGYFRASPKDKNDIIFVRPDGTYDRFKLEHGNLVNDGTFMGDHNYLRIDHDGEDLMVEMALPSGSLSKNSPIYKGITNRNEEVLAYIHCGAHILQNPQRVFQDSQLKLRVKEKTQSADFHDYLSCKAYYKKNPSSEYPLDIRLSACIMLYTSVDEKELAAGQIPLTYRQCKTFVKDIQNPALRDDTDETFCEGRFSEDEKNN